MDGVVVATGLISGHVTAGGRPVVGATIMSDGIVVAQTNPAGGYLTEVPCGNRLVTVTAPGYRDPPARLITVVLNTPADGNFEVQPLMTGVSRIRGVLASGKYPNYGGYIYPNWYDLPFTLGTWAAAELQVDIHSRFWKFDPPELVFPSGRIAVMGRTGSAPSYETWATGNTAPQPAVMDEYGAYHLRIRLQSSSDGQNWVVGDERYLVFGTVK